MATDFKQEHQFFLDHQDELVKKYPNKYLVIVGNKLIGAYDTVELADNAAQQHYTPGDYMIRQALPGDEAYTMHLGAMGVLIGAI